jgi:hypothetical protein
MYGDYYDRDTVAVDKFASILQRRTPPTRTMRETDELGQDSITSETNRKGDVFQYG